MICLICEQAETRPGKTAVKLERGKLALLVEDVPAQVCPSCGEAYTDEGTAIRLLAAAERMAESGALVDVLPYGAV